MSPDVEELLPCAICLENVPKRKFHVIGTCMHGFCVECLEQQILQNVQSKKFPVFCPEPQCGQTIATAECAILLDSDEAVAQLNKLEVEHSIPVSQRFYCPYPTCSALMIAEPAATEPQRPRGDGGMQRDPTPSAECMECHRLVCMICRSAWHSGYTCAQFQALNPGQRQAEDQQLFQLAQNERWKRCMRCGHMIELNTGCNHITCQCGYEFCYQCGTEWQGGTQRCGCAIWEERNLMTENERQRAYRQDRRTVNPRYKTRICRFWLTRGDCRYGFNCTFAHGEDELDRAA